MSRHIVTLLAIPIRAILLVVFAGCLLQALAQAATLKVSR